MRIFVFALVALLWAACTKDPPTPPSGAAIDGAQVFATMCSSCHGPDGKPNEVMTARLGVRDLTSPEFRVRATPALVEAQVRAGSKNKLMPSFEGALNDAQIRAVADFVASKTFPAHR